MAKRKSLGEIRKEVKEKLNSPEAKRSITLSRENFKKKINKDRDNEKLKDKDKFVKMFPSLTKKEAETLWKILDAKESKSHRNYRTKY